MPSLQKGKAAPGGIPPPSSSNPPGCQLAGRGAGECKDVGGRCRSMRVARSHGVGKEDRSIVGCRVSTEPVPTEVAKERVE